jgi:hypothetical protein
VVVVVLGVTVWDLSALPADLLAAAGVAAMLTGAGSWLSTRAGRTPPLEEPEGTEVLPRTSLATVALACGLTLVVVGLALGQALLWPGVGVLALGTGGLLRERLAARRLLEGRR